MDWLCKKRQEIIFSLFVFFALNFVSHITSCGYSICFGDTDDYMRLVRMRELFETGDWSNCIIARCNVPFGGDLHWTRLYDFFWMPFVYIANFFTNSIARSVELVGCIITPVIGAIAVIVFLRIMHVIFKGAQDILPFVATMVFAAHPIVRLNLKFCRADYHSFIILFVLLYLLCLALLTEAKSHKKVYTCMAVIGACNVWISPETLISLLIIDGVLFANALIYNDKKTLEGLYIKGILTASLLSIITFSSQIFIGIPLALLISSGLLIRYDEIKSSEKRRRQTGILGICFCVCALIFPTISAPEYDKISIVHILLYMYEAMFFVANLLFPEEFTLKQRLLSALMCGIALCAGFLVTYPKFLYGMGADVSDYVKRIWLNHVIEMQPAVKSSLRNYFIAYSFINLIATVTKITKLQHKKQNDSCVCTAIVWYSIITLSLFYNLLTGFALRMFPYAVIFSTPIFVDFCNSIRYVKTFHKVLTCFLTIVFTMALPFITLWTDNPPTNEIQGVSKKMKDPELYKVLDDLDAKPCTIMAHSNYGPAILYFTKHKIVGAPYHRQQQGIVFSYEVIENTYDEKRVKQILKFVDADYIFAKNPAFKNSLEEIILKNEKLPDWLERIPCKCKDIAIARILKEKL